MGERPLEGWHVDKRVPLAFIVFFCIQTITLVYVGSSWKAETDGRLESLEQQVADNVEIRRRMWDQIKRTERTTANLESRVAAIDERTQGIKSSVDRLLSLWLEERRGENQ